MEKAVAHYRLFEVKQRVEAGLVRATASAFRGARDLGIENLPGYALLLLRLQPLIFIKA
jgi:motility quorum-sensing regulator/GCU-specific mRNA interferase toxin